MVMMNVFRVLGDVSHTLSKCILIWAIHWNKSAEGVSLITQVLYAFVFVARYVDLFWTAPGSQEESSPGHAGSSGHTSALSWWNFVLKIFYITSSFYIILLMMKVYPRTREREKAWRYGSMCFGAAMLLGPILTVIIQRIVKKPIDLVHMLWSISEILESVGVLPQLLLLRQTTVPTVIDSFYLLALGAYRCFYVLNWITRSLDKKNRFHSLMPIAFVFGSIQTLLFLDFGWVYWTRQRVKLRGGGVVDSDDLRNSWLLRRVLGRKVTSIEEDDFDEDGPNVNGAAENGFPSQRIKKGGRWGPRGISISADDDVVNGSSTTKNGRGNQNAGGDELAGVLEDDDDDDYHDDAHERDALNPKRSGPSSSEVRGAKTHAQVDGVIEDDEEDDDIVVSAGEEWRR
ncbi:MAG: hypothetical protein M1823_003327 [Watsoniomyces obsoletus]|nr:MAG: hypothetical protein M1823_003327 [Watsoniomyces obsoletus]